MPALKLTNRLKSAINAARKHTLPAASSTPPSATATIESHLRYIGIKEQDITALRKVRAMVEQHADAFVEHFYAHLLSFEGTRNFLTDEKAVARLLKAQRAYLLSIFDANFDENYLNHRRLIGHTHFRIGLDFKWYIG